MKKILFFLITIAPFAVQAQVVIDRTKAPKPGPAPVIKVGEPASFVLANGLKVFVVQNTKLPRVAATLTIDREAILEGDKAGVVSLAGQLMRRGTKTMDKATLDEAVDYLGGNISTSSTAVSGFSLKSNFTKLMQLFADITLNPAFDAQELEKVRKQELSNLAQGKDDPNTIATNVTNKLAYGKNHPYGEIETETSVIKVTVDDVKKYYSTYFKPNIAYLIFVGDITAEEAKKLAEENFGKWQRGVVPNPVYKQPLPPSKTFIAIVDRPASVQSVINIITPVTLKPGSPDAIPSSVMNNLLGGGSSSRLYKNLREKYGFTYGAYSSISPDKLVANFTASASVRNEKTDSAIGQFLVEFNRLRNQPIDAKEVSQVKNEISGSFARSLEDPATIARFALNVARYGLPKDYYQNYLKNLALVDGIKVKEEAMKFVQPKNAVIVIVGNAKEISKGLEKYGEVKYFDAEGNEVKAPETKAVAAGVTPEKVLQKAADAVASPAVMAATKDLEMSGTLGVMGQSLKINQRHIFPGGYSQLATVQGMVIQKQLVKNGTYYQSQQGQDIPLDDAAKEEMDEDGGFFTDAYLLKQKGYKFTLNGIEQVDGKDAYVIDITSVKGRKFSNYYDVSSGLLVKNVSEQEGPQGKSKVTRYYKEYKEYSGVKVPVKITIDLNVYKMEIAIAEVKVNQGLKVDDLK